MTVIDWGVMSMPEWAVCYLEYGDAGDLSEEDLRLADEWWDGLDRQAKNGYGEGAYVALSYEDSERYFSGHPAFGLPCDCIDCRITVFTVR